MSKDMGIPLVDDWDDWYASVAVIYVADSDEQAKEEAQEAIDYHFFRGLGSMDLDTTSLVPGFMSVNGLHSWLRGATSKESGHVLAYPVEESIQNGTAVVGTPETCIELMKAQKNNGKRNVILGMFQFGNLTDEKATKSLRRFASEVYPHIRDY
jgi:alkanesulfonate monooxygenase SsuD/methylene tetrahydromethanopterin reductase-like flavin-dependent oxidoreductase (luciferase family)